MFRTLRIFHRNNRISFSIGTLVLTTFIGSSSVLFAGAQTPDTPAAAEKQQTAASEPAHKVVKYKKVVVIKKIKVKTATGEYVIREEREVKLVPIDVEPTKEKTVPGPGADRKVHAPNIEPDRDRHTEKITATESKPDREIKLPSTPSDHREVKLPKSPERSVGTRAGDPARVKGRQTVKHTTRSHTKVAQSTVKKTKNTFTGTTASKQTSAGVKH